MNVISEADLSLELLQSLFFANELSGRIVEVLPVAPELGISRDAYLEITYPDNTVLVLWHRPDFILRMRIVLVGRRECGLLPHDELLEHESFLNQQASCFGTVSVENILGITIDYPLPYRHGVLDQTILSAAEELVAGADLARIYFTT